MPNSSRKIDYVLYRETGKDLFFRNLSDNPVGGVELSESLKISSIDKPVVAFFIVPPRDQKDFRLFYFQWFREVFDKIRGNSEITIGNWRDNHFDSMFGLKSFTSSDPSILIIQSTQDGVKEAQRVITESDSHTFNKDPEEGAISFSPKICADRVEFDKELASQGLPDMTFDVIEKEKTRLYDWIFFDDGTLKESVHERLDGANKHADESDRKEGRFGPRNIKVDGAEVSKILDLLRREILENRGKTVERK